jgi:hypothetical protein
MGCIGALIRIPLATILGYLVFLVALFAGLTTIMVLAGQQFCFDGDSWVASEKFCVAALGVFGVAAFLGGFTAMRIGGTVAILLLCLVLGALGSLTALGVLGQAKEIRLKDRPEERPQELSPIQAAQWSETPKWCEWGNVGMGLAGIAVGGAVGKGRPREPKRPNPKD